MPENTKLGVNYRIAPQDSIEAVQQKSIEIVKPIAKKYGLTLKSLGFESDETIHYSPSLDKEVGAMYEVDYNGTLIMTYNQATKVAPVSPTTGPIWDLFSGTIQHSFAFKDGTVVPVGELMTGNTDTRHYLGEFPRREYE